LNIVKKTRFTLSKVKWVFH